MTDRTDRTDRTDAIKLLSDSIDMLESENLGLSDLEINRINNQLVSIINFIDNIRIDEELIDLLDMFTSVIYDILKSVKAQSTKSPSFVPRIQLPKETITKSYKFPPPLPVTPKVRYNPNLLLKRGVDGRFVPNVPVTRPIARPPKKTN